MSNLEQIVMDVSVLIAAVLLVILPPIYLWGCYKNHKYREHGRRTGEW